METGMFSQPANGVGNPALGCDGDGTCAAPDKLNLDALLDIRFNSGRTSVLFLSQPPDTFHAPPLYLLTI